jgi:hypothetical protein
LALLEESVMVAIEEYAVDEKGRAAHDD